MLAAATEAIRAHGEPISALFPTTASLYRSVGYEIAGWWGQRAIPVGELPRPIQLAGGLLIVAGVACIRWDEMRAAAPEHDDDGLPAPEGFAEHG